MCICVISLNGVNWWDKRAIGTSGMSKNKVIGRWQIRLATRKPRTWLLHPLHYCIASESMHELIFSISKGNQFSQLDWWFTYYGHVAQLIIVPRCSYLIRQNAKLWKTIWTMIECIYQLGDFMEWFAIHLTRFLRISIFVFFEILMFLSISIFVFWDLDVWII